MRLSLKAIADFKIIYKNRFGIDLTDDEANKQGLELLELFQVIYRQIPIEDAKILNALDTNTVHIDALCTNTHEQ